MTGARGLKTLAGAAAPVANAGHMPKRSLDSELRRVAEVGRAAAGGDVAALGGLIRRLGDWQPLVAEAAARALRRVAAVEWRAAEHSALVAALAGALGREGPAEDSGCRIRMEAVATIGLLRPPATLVEEPLRAAAATVQMENVGGAMEDVAVGLRASAALVMAQLGCDCLPELGLLLFDGLPDLQGRDPNRSVRLAAAQALGLLGDPAGAALLAVRLREPAEDGEVLAACIDALLALGHPRVAAWIRPLLHHAGGSACVAAASALGRLEPEAAVPAVVDRIGRSPAWLAEALTLALGGIRTEAARAALAELARDPRPQVREAAGALL